MKKTIPTLSIISKCNNFCKYCFQNNNKVQKNKDILSFSEIEKVVCWVKKEYDSIVILGGEPLLHPDIMHIMDYLSVNLNKIRIITNLITEDENKIIKLNEKENINWLINVTADKCNREIFNNNIKILFNKKFEKANNNKIIVFSLTLFGDNEDFYFIDLLINILKQIPNNLRRVRLTPYMPNNGNLNSVYKLQNYDLQYLYFMEKVKKELKESLSVSFDCGMNNCFITEKTLNKLHEYNLLGKIKSCSGPFIDITTDLKVLFCHYSSQKYFPAKYYYEFDSPKDSLDYFIDCKKKFIEQQKYDCASKINRKICPKDCFNFCPSIISKILSSKLEY